MRMGECILVKTLLVLGAGLDQIPGILKAKEMGCYIICLDGNQNAEAKKYCDEFHVVSIKHIDQLENFVENSLDKKVDGVIAFGVDIPYIISYIADKLRVNYTIPLLSAKLSEDKYISKEFMKKHNISIPNYKLVDSFDDIDSFIKEFGFPIILKPVDNSASRGISLIDSYDGINEYYDYALKESSKKKVIIEKYLNGPQISTESFVINGKIYNIGFADRNYEDMQKFLPNIIENGGDLPSIFMKEKHKKQLEEYLMTISKELNIKNGVIKGDIVIYEDDLHIIEFALRLSGGNFSTIEIPASTGVDFLKIAIKLHLNESIDEKLLEVKKEENICLRYKFLEDIKLGKVKSIQNLLKDKCITSSNFLSVGDEVVSNKTYNHANRVASVITSGISRGDAIQNAENYLKELEFIIE